MDEIRFTKSKLPFGWMGNMSRYSITYDDKVWGSVEHLFQALRFDKDKPFRELIRECDNPFEAKQIAKKYREHMSINPCGLMDYVNMGRCLRLKLEQHPLLIDMLLETGDAMIYEDVTARGDVNSNLIWGAMKLSDGTWKGKNVMGRHWMGLRLEYMEKEKMKQEPTTTEIEIERRFLLKSIPPLKYSAEYKIEQYYMPLEDGKVERVRALYTIEGQLTNTFGQVQGDNVVKRKYIHTIKKPTDGLGMIETERFLDLIEFTLFKDKSDRAIYKTRYVLPHSNVQPTAADKKHDLKWEIDKFDSMDLAIAEIEIPSEDYELVIPDSIKPYIIMEITGMKQFSNSNLAQ
jgi:predicted NAD-dependent protein-ADP-ribosyltransferase YbiA (DUF1768 family)/CYTH domain-containing protein